MTGPCSGTGVGVAKPGYGLTVEIGTAAIGGALAGLSGWSGAAIFAAVAVIHYELGTFCPAALPSPPVFSDDEILALSGGVTALLYPSALLKFLDFLKIVFWPILCECSGGTPTNPAPSDFPAGGSQVVVVTPTPVGVCGVVGHDGIPFTLPSSGVTPIVGIQFSDYPNLSLIRMHYVANKVGSFAHGASPIYIRWSSPGVFTDVNYGVSPPDSIWRTADFVPLAGYTAFTCGFIDNQISQDTHEMWCEMFCGPGGGTQAGCCPPDPATQAQLEAILQMVTLIQRQNVPFGYVPGNVHAGLSGDGSFSIPALVGFKIEATTIPISYGSRGTHPVEYFDLGYVTMGSADGYDHSYRFEHSPQVVLPPRASGFTELGYTLGAGVVATITELLREP